jgi:pimeloyl-ACP methyl ester carboxylesterase
MEDAITFQSGNGRRLFGIVHIPEQPLPKGERIGVNLLNPGIKYRVAPNRLNVRLARHLCKKGLFVFRFDPAGVGDSEGDLPQNVLVPDIWEKIQKGLFVPDVLAGNDFFLRKCKLDKLVLIGSCGGAITSLLASGEDTRVDGLCLIDTPVNLRTASMSFADKVAVGGSRADWLFSEYVKRLVRPKSWYRFVTLRTNFGAFQTVFRMKLQKALYPLDKGKVARAAEEVWQDNRLNNRFFHAFESFAAMKKPVLFVLAGNDPGTEIFKRYFVDGYLKRRGKTRELNHLMEIFTIENANHVYTLTESQESLIGRVSSWLDRVTSSGHPLDAEAAGKTVVRAR